MTNTSAGQTSPARKMTPGDIAYAAEFAGYVPTRDEVAAVVAAGIWEADELDSYDAGPMRNTSQRKCEARARRGTGEGMCDRPLDEHEQCDRAADHITFTTSGRSDYSDARSHCCGDSEHRPAGGSGPWFCMACGKTRTDNPPARRA
jgi:hypothetical protein